MASQTLVDSGSPTTRRQSYSRAISSPLIGKSVEAPYNSTEGRRRSNVRVLCATEDGATTWHSVEPTSLGEYETSSLPSLGRFDSWVGNPMFADLVFFLGTEKASIPAHRVILASSDSIFAELLQSENSDTLISALGASSTSVFSFTEVSAAPTLVPLHAPRPIHRKNFFSMDPSTSPSQTRSSATPSIPASSSSPPETVNSVSEGSPETTPEFAHTNGKDHRRTIDSGVLPVVLEDVKPEIFLKLLGFLYCAKVTLYFDVVADYNVLLDLLDLSDRFRVPSLSRLLINFLETDSNALKIIGPELISQLKTKIMTNYNNVNTQTANSTTHAASKSQPSSRKSSVSSTASTSSTSKAPRSDFSSTNNAQTVVLTSSGAPSGQNGGASQNTSNLALGTHQSATSTQRLVHRRRSEASRSDDEMSEEARDVEDAEESFEDAIQYNLSSRSIQFSDTIKRRIAVAKLRIEEQARKMKADSEEINWRCAKNDFLPPRVHHTATSYGNALVIVGGHDGNLNGVGSGVEFLIEPSDERDSLIWKETRKTGAGPRTLHSHATCRVGNKFYIYGGIVDGEKSSKLYILAVINDETVHWSVPRLTGDLPPALTHHTLLRYDKQLILFGGLLDDAKEAQGDVWVMDTDTNRWSRLVSTWAPNAQSLVHSSSSSSTSSHTNAPSSGAKTNTNFQISRFGHCALVVGSKMLVIGGQDHLGNYLNDTLTIDLETHVWTLLTNNKKSTVPRMSMHSAVRVGRHILVHGGRRKSSGLIKELWKLIWDEGGTGEVFWTKLKSSSSPSERYGHSVNRIGSKIYVVGGSNDKGKPLGDLWEANTVHLPLEMDARVIEHSELEISSLVGMGNFSQVRRGIWNNHLIAIKLIKNRGEHASSNILGNNAANNNQARSIIKNNKDKQRTIKDFKSEVELLSQLKHPNLVTFLGYCLEPNAIVMEYLPQNLHDYLIENRGKLESQQMIDFAYDIARGMEYLHRNSIIHRDLKSFNILLDENLNVKIADFGIARVKTNTSTMTTTGTIAWTAPEILRHEAYNEKSDVYSYAIVLWEICSEGEIPFDDDFQSPMEAGIAVATGQIRPMLPKDTDPNWAALMERCWKEDPNARPSFTEIMDQIKKFE